MKTRPHFPSQASRWFKVVLLARLCNDRQDSGPPCFRLGASPFRNFRREAGPCYVASAAPRNKKAKPGVMRPLERSADEYP